MQPLIPTQLQLTGEQRARLREVALSEGKGLSEVAREAIDAYLLERAGPADGAGMAHAPFGGLPVASSGAWDRA